MVQNGITYFILAIALAYAIYRLFKAFKQIDNAEVCSSCAACPAKKEILKLQKNKKKIS